MNKGRVQDNGLNKAAFSDTSVKAFSADIETKTKRSTSVYEQLFMRARQKSERR